VAKKFKLPIEHFEFAGAAPRPRYYQGSGKRSGIDPKRSESPVAPKARFAALTDLGFSSCGYRRPPKSGSRAPLLDNLKNFAQASERGSRGKQY
jgi:hypothetical protein